MSRNRARTDTIVLVSILVAVLALYVASLYSTQIKGIAFNNLVSNIRFITDKILFPIIIGSIASAILNHIFPHKYRSYILAGSGIIPILNALWIGIFKNRSIYETLYTGLAQYKSGMTLGATITYLIISPYNSISLIILVVFLFGFKTSLIIYGSLAFIAFASGMFAEILQYSKFLPKSAMISRRDPNFNLADEISEDLQKFKKCLLSRRLLFKHLKEIVLDYLVVLKVVLKWSVLGVLMAGLIGGALKEKEIDFFFGEGVFSAISILFLAAILEIFSEGAIILAYMFYHLTGALGTAFLFLIMVNVIDFLEISDFRHIMGKKISAYYLFMPLVLSLIFTYILN